MTEHECLINWSCLSGQDSMIVTRRTTRGHYWVLEQDPTRQLKGLFPKNCSSKRKCCTFPLLGWFSKQLCRSFILSKHIYTLYNWPFWKCPRNLILVIWLPLRITLAQILNLLMITSFTDCTQMDLAGFGNSCGIILNSG